MLRSRHPFLSYNESIVCKMPWGFIIDTRSLNVSLMFKLFLRITSINFHGATFPKLPCMSWIHRKDIPTLYTNNGLYKWLRVSSASENDLAPIQWQAFTWNNDASACTDTNNRHQDALITLNKGHTVVCLVASKSESNLGCQNRVRSYPTLSYHSRFLDRGVTRGCTFSMKFSNEVETITMNNKLCNNARSVW